MWIQYLAFCLGAGLVQNAYVKQPGQQGPSAWDAPMWFSEAGAQILIPIIAVGAFVAELVIGFMFFPWWVAILSPVVSLLVIGFMLPSRNPAPPFFIGMILLIGATIFLLV